MDLATYEAMVTADSRRVKTVLRSICEKKIDASLGARQLRSIFQFQVEMTTDAIDKGLTADGYVPRPKKTRKPRLPEQKVGGSTPGKPR